MDFFEAFAHTWGSTGTVDDSLTTTQYDQGWNFIGSRPPRLGEFNKREKLIDQRLKWLYDQIKTAADAHGVTLNGSNVGGLLAILQDLIGDHASASDPHGQYQLESGMSAYATLASPNLTGVPTAPTAAPGTNTKQLANTEFVMTAASNAVAGVATTFASSAENASGTVENKAVDPLGIREAFNATGYAPVYACRAWVNFNGKGTVAIRASGNVSSITDNGTGDYTVNFATAMPDANYACIATYSSAAGENDGVIYTCENNYAVASIRVFSKTDNRDSYSLYDRTHISVAIFR